MSNVLGLLMRLSAKAIPFAELRNKLNQSIDDYESSKTDSEKKDALKSIFTIGSMITTKSVDELENNDPLKIVKDHEKISQLAELGRKLDNKDSFS